jgi:hypothetical protein
MKRLAQRALHISSLSSAQRAVLHECFGTMYQAQIKFIISALDRLIRPNVG